MSVPMFLGKVIDVVFNKSGMDSAAFASLTEYSLLLFGIFVLGGFANFARVYMFGNAGKFKAISLQDYRQRFLLPSAPQLSGL